MSISSNLEQQKMRKLISDERKAVAKENFVFSIATSFGKLSILRVLVIYIRYPFSECY